MRQQVKIDVDEKLIILFTWPNIHCCIGHSNFACQTTDFARSISPHKCMCAILHDMKASADENLTFLWDGGRRWVCRICYKIGICNFPSFLQQMVISYFYYSRVADEPTGTIAVILWLLSNDWKCAKRRFFIKQPSSQKVPFLHLLLFNMYTLYFTDF